MQSLDRRRFIVGCSAASGISVLPQIAMASEQVPHIVGLSQSDTRRTVEIVQAFMKKYSVPGISMAFASRGKLKTTIDVGYADQAKEQVLKPQQLFRIASLSKPITAVAVLKLMEQGKINLSHKPFSTTGMMRDFLEGKHALSAENTQRLANITILHLLHHTAGGWNNKSGDPMFAREALSYNHHELIKWAVNNRALDVEPGTVYRYSNFGYCLLGRIIERVTGLTYEEYVQQKILRPIGITEMQIGRDYRISKAENEVVYHGQKKENPYGNSIKVSRMDSHGGWIASGKDLVRFITYVDGFSPPRDLLSQTSIAKMKQTTTAAPNYALGWQVNKSDNWWHTGSLPGTSSIMARINNQYAWAVLANTRSKEPGYFGALDALPWDIFKAIKSWPRHDLF